MKKLEQIKEQVRELLSTEDHFTAVQLSSLCQPAVSSAAVTIALNQLHADKEVQYIPNKGWTLAEQGGDDADAA